MRLTNGPRCGAGFVALVFAAGCNALVGIHEGLDPPVDASIERDSGPDGNPSTSSDADASMQGDGQRDTSAADGSGSPPIDDVSVDRDARSDALLDTSMEVASEASTAAPDASIDASFETSGDAAFDLGAPPDVTADTSLPPVDAVAETSSDTPPPTCTDQARNGDETDVDCGGSCAPCGLGGRCATARDCVTGKCGGTDGGTCGPWSKLLQASVNAYAEHAVVDADGNVYVAASYQGTPSGDLGNQTTAQSDVNGVILKYSADGTLLWPKVLTSLRVKRVALDSKGNVIIFGNGSPTTLDSTKTSAGSSDLVVAKLNPANGSPVWTKNFGGVDAEEAYDLAVGVDDSIAVAGRTLAGGWSFGEYVVPTLAARDSIGIFALLDSAGKPQWAEFVSYEGHVYALGAALDHAGNVVVAGAMTGYGAIADAGAGQLPDAGQLGDAGEPLHTGDMFLGQFTHGGRSAWSKRYFGNATGSNQGPQAAQIAIDDGGTVLAGVIYEHVEFGNGGAGTSGQPTLYAARFDTLGSNQWASASGQCPLRSGEPNPISNTARTTLDASRRPLLFGSFTCASIALGVTTLTNRGALGRDLFILRLDPTTGGFAKPHQWGSSGDEILEHVAVHPKTDNLILTGELSAELDLGDGPLTKPNGANVAGFVASVGVLP